MMAISVLFSLRSLGGRLLMKKSEIVTVFGGVLLQWQAEVVGVEFTSYPSKLKYRNECLVGITFTS